MISKDAKVRWAFVLVTIAILVGAFFSIGCASKSIERDAPKHREPISNAKVYKPTGSWTIRSEKDIPDIGKVSTSNGVIIWDLQGAILDGDKQSGKCDQNENQEPLFRASTSLYLKNGFIRNAKNAATFSASNSGVEGMTWLNICEDAVSTNKGAYNMVVKNSEFMGRPGNDKAIQLNEAKGAVVTGNMIYGVVTGMRLGDSDTTEVSDVVKVGNNRFVSVKTAYHPSKITVEEISKSSYDGVEQEWHFANGARKK